MLSHRPLSFDDDLVFTLDRWPRTRIVALIVAFALFMENLDATIIATALPAIARDLGEDPLHLSLAITSYLLSLAIFIPLSGWMADRYGARSVFRNAIVLFVLGSIGCALSSNVYGLIAARVLQGMGGAMMVPVARLVMLREVPKSELISVMALITIPALVAPIVGPPLGGLIVTYFDWEWIFLINVPIGVLGWWVVSRFIGDFREQVRPPLDLAGWWLMAGGLAGLVFGLETMGKHVFAPTVTAIALLGGTSLLLLYVRHARSEPDPLIRLELLRIPTLRASLTGGSLFRVGLGGFTLLMPMMLQLGYGLSPMQSGLLTFATAAGALMMKPIAPRITRRFGFRQILVYNTVLCAMSLAFCGLLSPDWPVSLIIGFLVLNGLLRSLQFTCVNALGYSEIREADMSQASSLTSTAQQLALSVGVGLASQVLNLSMAATDESGLSPADFRLAFVVMGVVTLASAVSFRRLATDAGSSVSGHRVVVADADGASTAD